MAKPDETVATPRDSVISIIGPGMRVVGDCETDGTLRIGGVDVVEPDGRLGGQQ